MSLIPYYIIYLMYMNIDVGIYERRSALEGAMPKWLLAKKNSKQ